MSVINQVINGFTVQQVRVMLQNNAEFMRYEDNFLNSDIFRDQVIYKSNVMGMSVNEIVTEYLKSNGCI